MIQMAVSDIKPYDREYLTQSPGATRIAWQFHDLQLSTATAPAAKGAQAVRVFVNDQAGRGRAPARTS